MAKEFDTPFLLSLYMHVQRMECILVQVGSTRLSVTYGVVSPSVAADWKLLYQSWWVYQTY